jgi:hypothetical protein
MLMWVLRSVQPGSAFLEAIDHQRMGGADRDAQMLCNLLQGVAAEAVHFEGDPRPFGEAGNGLFELPEVGPTRCDLLGGTVIRDQPNRRFAVCHETARLRDEATPAVDREVAHDAIEILDGFVDQRALRGVGEPQVRLLHDIFSMGVIAGYPTGISQQIGPMDQEETEMFLVGIH